MWRKLRRGFFVKQELSNMSDNLKVAAASVFGTGSPIVHWFVNAGPTLEVVLTIGQIVVAVATALYIFRKWKNARAQKKK